VHCRTTDICDWHLEPRAGELIVGGFLAEISNRTHNPPGDRQTESDAPKKDDSGNAPEYTYYRSI